MSVKDNWKQTGKGVGKSFAGLGKAIAKSVKVGVDAQPTTYAKTDD